MGEIPEDVKIGEHLVQAGAITQEQLDEALEVQKDLGGRLGKILAKLGYVGEETLLKYLAKQLAVDMVKLSERKIPPALLRMIPESTIRKKKVIPISLTDGTLTVAMVYPRDLDTLEEIKFETGENVTAVIASEKEIEEVITNYLGPPPAEAEKKEEIFPETPPPLAEEKPPAPQPEAVRDAVAPSEARDARYALLRLFGTRVKLDALILTLLNAGVIDEETLARTMKEIAKSE